MIFVTIGTQEPFDRLVEVMDEIAFLLNDTTVIAQVFQTNFHIKNMETIEFVSPKDYDTYFNEAKLIVSHAGMGTIISALVKDKPIIVMPRLLKFNEHRNEHQLATAQRFDALKYVHVAYDAQELKDKLLAMWPDKIKPLHSIGTSASNQLIDSVRSFIESA